MNVARALGASQSSLLASFCVSAPISAQLRFAGCSLVAKEEDATAGGERIFDFSNHPSNVTNVLEFVSWVVWVMTLGTGVGLGIFASRFVCFVGSCDVMSGPPHCSEGEVTP